MKRFSNILAVVNTRHNEASALHRALSLTKSNQASLTVVSLLEQIPGELHMGVLAVDPGEILEIAKAEELRRLEDMVEAVNRDEVPVEMKVLVGIPFLEVINQVLKGNHDLVIKNVEPSEKYLDALFGSTDKHLMRKCPCPIWVIKPGHKHHQRILACVDYEPDCPQNDELNCQIVELAASLATAESSELHIIHALEPYGERILRAVNIVKSKAAVSAIVEKNEQIKRKWFEALLDECLETENKGGEVVFPKYTLHPIKGRAQQVIPMKARELDVDLIIMGTVARTGVPGYFMGNTSESIINQVECSMLTMKPPGFVSPVKLSGLNSHF